MTPEGLTARRATVSKTFGDQVRRFCATAPTPKAMFDAFAPKGTLESGGVKLESGKPFVLRNGVVVSLRLYDPYDHVIWWNDTPGGQVTEWHVDLDSSVRILPFEDLVKEHGQLFGPEIGRLPQGHPLADIPHQYRLRCGPRDVSLIVNEIVWQGDFVGKVGSLAIATIPPDAGTAAVPTDGAPAHR